MNLLSSIIFILFIINVVAILFFSIVWKNRDVNFAKYVLTGTYIYRDLSKYIRKDRASAFLILSYSGVGLFIALVASMVLANI